MRFRRRSSRAFVKLKASGIRRRIFVAPNFNS
jgi:predicted deacetylase